ncbi:MAG: bifunctional [glutamine synthetase] adenylyltransferase/[glutamine synthetase]-adenylyl-L-tyrosine phosphorylase [Rhodospirillaceae bacterium]|nr:bifunctional [glutamine synthetase] adenylyltransferase/[glutamine synthetase]-adenylyl-L-tyrosine phosphorylase [Rhodospirillaceae bacterium]
MQSIPAPFDTDAVGDLRDDWLASAESDVARHVLDDPAASSVLDCIFGNSPFLSQAVIRDPGFVCELLCAGPDKAFSQVLSNISDKSKESLNDNDIARILRVAKRRAAITIALADIAGLWPLEKITGTLSQFAGAALDLAVAHLLRQAAGQGAFELRHPDEPLKDSGFIVIGMGKLGAFELNYSSDIDLIVLYDADKIETSRPDRLQNNFVRLTRNLVKLMDERTADGYVFRTDLRLRPDPSATPLALSVIAAETYYESIGQNWERAAMIKARAIAGDKEAGNAFLKFLQPFVWRKSLDFAAIQDIHSIKRQINAHKGGTDIRTQGHNIKLGQGGIREIEFFAQTQQLIWGGREPSLRSPVTVQALADLTAFGQCDEQTADELTNSYGFLRRIEHRLQMINDEQTQTLPDNDEGYARLATFLGYPSADAFSEDLLAHLHRVQNHYGQLFAEAPSLGAEGSGNLVFTGGDPDPETLETIRTMGFRAPETVDGLIRAWHHGRHRATQSTRAREILTELIPRLLEAMAATADPDAALLRFDEFLKGLPAGVQLFSMFQAQPHLLDLIAEIIGIAPRLARHMSAHPSVLDSVLTGDFFGALPDIAELQTELHAILDRAEYFEAVLDASRRWAHDRRFQVGVQRLQNSADPADASRALSHIAETIVSSLYSPVAQEFAHNHGIIAGGEMAVVALGKLGSREMTASSDLDMVFIYDVPEDAEYSDGKKPLPPTQYFARLGQRLINAITTLTAEGSLYEVDMRLRPSGNAGPVATTTEAFRIYHAQSAWTWEHMALTRARVIHATSDAFRHAVESEINAIVTRPRDAEKLLRDVADMRQRLAREKPASCLWSLKQLRGGMVDIEFIVQYLTLKHAAEHPEVIGPNTLNSLSRLADADVLDAGIAARLTAALKLWHALQGMLSLTVDDDITTERVAEFPKTLNNRLARIGGAADFAELEAAMHLQAAEIYGLFQELIEEPAGALPPRAEHEDDIPAPLI